MESIILASASPRRREILTLLDIPFTVEAAAEETAPFGLPPAEYALALAESKAKAVFAKHPDSVVLGADTVVVRDDRVLGKPRDREDAIDMLLSLSDRTHTVITGVYVCTPNGMQGFADTARVHFYPITRTQAEAYVDTNEPMDKAGGYAIQGRGARFVKGIEGDFYTVMGLPAGRLLRFLDEFLGQE